MGVLHREPACFRMPKVKRERKDRDGWTVHDKHIRTKVVMMNVRRYTGAPFERDIALRIDSRDGEFRVDMKPSSIEPWESICGFHGFTDLRGVKKFADRWLEEVSTQKTIHPSIPRDRLPGTLGSAVGSSSVE